MIIVYECTRVSNENRYIATPDSSGIMIEICFYLRLLIVNLVGNFIYDELWAIFMVSRKIILLKHVLIQEYQFSFTPIQLKVNKNSIGKLNSNSS